MNHIIWKYSFGKVPDFTLEMPKGAKVLCAKERGGEFWLWAAVDPTREHEERHFMIAPTGGLSNPRIGSGEYISTIVEGIYVWHIFEEKE